MALCDNLQHTLPKFTYFYNNILKSNIAICREKKTNKKMTIDDLV